MINGDFCWPFSRRLPVWRDLAVPLGTVRGLTVAGRVRLQTVNSGIGRGRGPPQARVQRQVPPAGTRLHLQPEFPRRPIVPGDGRGALLALLAAESAAAGVAHQPQRRGVRRIRQLETPRGFAVVVSVIAVVT